MWLNRFFGRRNKEVRSQSPAKLTQRRPSARQLQMEPLEQRRLLAVHQSGQYHINDSAPNATPYPSSINVSMPEVRQIWSM